MDSKGNDNKVILIQAKYIYIPNQINMKLIYTCILIHSGGHKSFVSLFAIGPNQTDG
jgi:hypothetical protein